MNKATIALAVFVFALMAIWESSGLPLDAPLPESEVEHPQNHHIRVRRFTCDVLSFEAKGVKLNHAACGAHCLFRGRTGGYCNKKRVCICR